jgi:rod shape-determining protein MreD
MLILFTLVCSLLLMLLPIPMPVAPARPAFYAMTVLFWIVAQPRLFGLIAAWCCGIALDVLYGTPLSEHGLALAVAAYLVISARRLFWSFSLLQQALAMLPVFALYEFVLFWIDGVAGLATDPLWRWLPAVTSAVLWPLWAFLLERFTHCGVQ